MTNMKKIIDVLKSLHPDRDYAGSSDYISDGLIDSFDMMQLIARLEEEYGVHVAGTDLMPQNFSSLEALQSLLAGYGVKDI